MCMLHSRDRSLARRRHPSSDRARSHAVAEVLRGRRRRIATPGLGHACCGLAGARYGARPRVACPTVRCLISPESGLGSVLAWGLPASGATWMRHGRPGPRRPTAGFGRPRRPTVPTSTDCVPSRCSSSWRSTPDSACSPAATSASTSSSCFPAIWSPASSCATSWRQGACGAGGSTHAGCAGSCRPRPSR